MLTLSLAESLKCHPGYPSVGFVKKVLKLKLNVSCRRRRDSYDLGSSGKLQESCACRVLYQLVSAVRRNLGVLSWVCAPASEVAILVLKEIRGHPGWNKLCETMERKRLEPGVQADFSFLGAGLNIIVVREIIYFKENNALLRSMTSSVV